ncbi:MAG: hypothetical protein SAL07_20645 [Oscillatoria sp. PMC 1051.18]|nr:hypothetical protein [Oscillatoria sp. PMC 1050.18]MEC5032316.1 hypothetical protein [Oscillatoria sp. PMC 1051.18]
MPNVSGSADRCSYTLDSDRSLYLHPPRHLSCFVLGLLTLVANLLNHLPIHLSRWSSFPSTPVDDFFGFNSS